MDMRLRDILRAPGQAFGGMHELPVGDFWQLPPMPATWERPFPYSWYMSREQKRNGDVVGTGRMLSRQADR
jgi:hypothetical protein